MNSKIKTIVETTDVEIIGSDDFLNPFVTRGSIYYEEDDYLVEIDVDGLTIECNIWVGEIQYEPSDEEVDYFYDIISKEIMEYNDEARENRYHDYTEQDNSFYIR